MNDWPYPFWIAHRGAGKLAPENTLAAFRLGAAQGYRMFECDAKLSADGVVFLLHDDTLMRTTSGWGTAGDWSWGELSLLDAGGWHSAAYVGEPLPTLQAICRYCNANGYLLNIEIKPTPGTELDTGAAVARLVHENGQGAYPWPLLSSFEPRSLGAARAIAPHIPRALLLESLWPDWLECAKGLDCCAIVAEHPLWTAPLVDRVHEVGMRCLAYTVNDALTAHRLQALGMDGIITDRVDTLGRSHTG